MDNNKNCKSLSISIDPEGGSNCAEERVAKNGEVRIEGGEKVCGSEDMRGNHNHTHTHTPSPCGGKESFGIEKGKGETGQRLNGKGRQRQKQKKLNRHMSLGTAFSIIKRETDLEPSSSLPRSYSMSKENYSMFRTHRQNSPMQGQTPNAQESELADNCPQLSNGQIPAGRYFDALKGPELDVLKDYEDILLPLDEKWPFLLRFPIGSFGICLGLSSQAILWKNLAKIPWLHFLHVAALRINMALWCLSLTALIVILFTYTLKCIFYLEAVRREYYHPVRVNFFFAPWIVCMFLTIGLPQSISEEVHPALWCIFMSPVFALELKIYGQWLSGGKRRLSKVANPSSHLSIVGNFVGALLAAQVGWKEHAMFFWSIGVSHYTVLFVTLYQRLPTSEALPQELHPVFFLFIAAPCTASVAWEKIHGKFDSVSRLAYFIAIFLYASLVVRVNFFRGFRFSVAWWAYTFPMTAASIATIRYSNTVDTTFTRGLAIVLSLISSTTVSTLFVTTLLHALVWHSLFPNDLAIAITHKRIKHKNKKEKPASIDLEHHTAPIKRSMELLRSGIKKQQARLFSWN
ncbi:hypothetical protein SUGI_0939910 [Cryptomeria japonica]|uniref:guard cell S-type anion channel SLAC1 n=1 Tax=Cryptomeria japonica TaxID=3369 RepID=UPI002414CA9E|nr:guard cell S-type anion channel SLAC1 [Cryptomeria japonica]GLJ44706.1 hypothetical protein SUGI_0939910 [Cryptomeria japonica]